MSHKGMELGAGRGADSLPDLSGRFFGDSALTQSYAAPRASADVQLSPASVESLTLTNPYKAAPRAEVVVPAAEVAAPATSTPMLDSVISQQLQGAQSLKLSTAAENQAGGTQPDYRVVQGDNGQLVLEKVGDGDPLADGELNIEMDTKGKDLQKALAEADKGLKEYYRELIAAWQVNHPGTNYPGWWNDILHSQPDVPTDTQPVPMRQANPRPQVQPQERQPQPAPSRQAPSAPKSDVPPMGPGGNMGGGTAGGGGLPFMQNFGGSGRGGGDGQGAGFDQGGRYRSGGEHSERASSGSTPNADQQTVLNNVKTVVEVAKEVGVDPKLAVAMMLVESGGDNRAVGDNGTSFGLYQLHQGGMLTDAGLTKEQAFDPRTNAEVSLGNLAKIDQNYSDPGKAAAASQRPAEPADYARKVNASMDEAAELIAMAEKPSGAAVASIDTTQNQHRPTARG